MVSSNRSRENDYDSVTTSLTRSQRRREVTLNVKVTGVPMRTRPMSTSVDPRVGQLVTRPCRRVKWEYTKAPRFHDDLRTRDTRPNHTTTRLALWSSLTLGTRSHPWVPARHPQYTGAHHDGKAVDGPKPPQRLTNPLRTLTVSLVSRQGYNTMNFRTVPCPGCNVQ